MFPVLFIPPEASDSLEPLGTKPKFWFKGEHNIDCLFKETTLNTGEDWAEKIVSELCWFLGLPHVDYTLAEWQGKRGVVCGNFVPEGGRLVLGNELLARINPKYPDQKRFGVRQYTLRRVLAIFRTRETQIKAPLNWTSFAGVTTALDVFIGYLLLDAWIANQDRHHENWGLIVTPALTQHLAPSYDHASSLGRNETEHNRTDRLTTHDRGRSMDRYVARAKSAFFASPARKQLLSTVEAFHEVWFVLNHGVIRLSTVMVHDQAQQLVQLRAHHAEVAEAVDLAQDFATLVRQREPERLDPWLQRATTSTVEAIRRFATGLSEDYAAVKAGVTLSWSTGPVEGHSNRLKMLKRQMFGRAHLALLSRRFVRARSRGQEHAQPPQAPAELSREPAAAEPHIPDECGWHNVSPS